MNIVTWQYNNGSRRMQLWTMTCPGLLCTTAGASTAQAGTEVKDCASPTFNEACKRLKQTSTNMPSFSTSLNWGQVSVTVTDLSNFGTLEQSQAGTVVLQVACSAHLDCLPSWPITTLCIRNTRRQTRKGTGTERCPRALVCIVFLALFHTCTCTNWPTYNPISTTLLAQSSDQMAVPRREQPKGMLD